MVEASSARTRICTRRKALPDAEIEPRINTRLAAAVHKKQRWFGPAIGRSGDGNRDLEIQLCARDRGEGVLAACSRCVDLVGRIRLQRQRAIQEAGDIAQFNIGFACLRAR